MASKTHDLPTSSAQDEAAPSIFFYRKAYVTYSLAAMNLLIFLLMISQGSGGADRIYRNTTVLVPQALNAIEWWKLVAANFVHRDLALLLQNMVFVCALGPFLEFALGRKKYLLVYLASGIGALFLVILYALIFDRYVPFLRVHRPQIVGGASAAVLGVIGARGAIFLRHWRREKSSVARNHFLFMLLLVLSQMGTDLLRFNVAFGAHLTGAVLGFGLGLLLERGSLNLKESNPISLGGTEKQV